MIRARLSILRAGRQPTRSTATRRATPDRAFVLGRVLVLAATAFAAAPALAIDWQFGGHVKYQYTYTDYRNEDLNAALGGDPATDQDVDIRVKAEGTSGPWDFAAHYELLATHGDTLAVRRAAPFLPFTSGTVTGLPDDRRRLFDLTDTVTDRTRTAAVQRLDRLSIGHGTPERVVRFGRQAVTWGNGLVFYPLDFVNPFSPIAIDKDYKTGDDMLYAQWLLASGGDVQTIIVPRRDVATHTLESDESTYAGKLRLRYAGIDVDVIAARHFGDNIAGVGFAKTLGGAVWRFDTSYTDVQNQSGVWSFVTNIDYSWTWSGRNVYGYAEYFRNGFGETDRARYPTPNPALAARLARGELYTLARDYVALGLQVELHPLLNAFTNLIWNADDGSRFLQLRGVYDWQQNVQLIAGVNLPAGDRGDEYGGIPVAPTGLFLTPGRAIYGRAAYYF